MSNSLKFIRPRLQPREEALENEGFTIVELLIAMTILSTILVMATVMLIQMGVIYTKGVNSANIQNAARNIQDDVSSVIRFSGYAPSALATTVESINGQPYSVDAICIGSVRYTFIPNTELGTDSAANHITGKSAGTNTPHVLWRDIRNTAPSSVCVPIDMNNPNGDSSTTGGGYEMAASHTRLTKFAIAETPVGSGVYDIDVWMAYGDSDLVNTNTSSFHSTCNGGMGEQFCAVSELHTSAVSRLLN